MIMFCLLLTAVFGSVFSDGWKASVVRDIEALVSSCVVVPCTFSTPGGELPGSRRRAIWHLKEPRTEIIYHEDQTKVLDSFKGRTKLLGPLGQNNCTLELTKVEDHDNSPFCFRIEMVRKDDNKQTSEKFSFVEDCVNIRMLHDAPKPSIISSKKPVEGQPFTITCSVRHTCPSHVPTFKWSRGTEDEVTTIQKEMISGIWETQSMLTIVPKEKDDHAEVTCTAEFAGGKSSSNGLTLNVKRTENLNHIIIPAAAAAGTAVLFSIFCVIMTKKYKSRIIELQNQNGSVLNRMSRISRRFRSGGN